MSHRRVPEGDQSGSYCCGPGRRGGQLGLWQVLGAVESGTDGLCPLCLLALPVAAVAGWQVPGFTWHVHNGRMRLVPFRAIGHLHVPVKDLLKSLPILKSSRLSFSCVFLGVLYTV